MIKLLFWIVLLAVVAFVLGFKRGRPAPREEQPDRRPSPPQALPESMVRCAECGTHLPESEALPGRGGHFCGAAHRAAPEARLEAADPARARGGA